MLGLPLLISTFFPRKIDGLSFSGFQPPYRIFNAFQSILLRIFNAGIKLRCPLGPTGLKIQRDV